jgi:hypothetical protein
MIKQANQNKHRSFFCNFSLVTLVFLFVICSFILPKQIIASATGGNITQDGDYKIHSFTSSGTFTTDLNIDNIEILIVAGGGGGGNDRGGGGGAGGVISQTGLSISAGSYPITVGAGGATLNNGENSSAFNLTAIGGGAGGAHGSTNHGSNGGSGGGAAMNYFSAIWSGGTGVTGQGNNGAMSGARSDNPRNTGGGGGAGGPGVRGAGTTVSPDGGIGIISSISGAATYYAGGGGGSWGGSDRSSGGSGIGGLGGGGTGHGTKTATDGAPNTGGGGGGTRAGGSGIVIIRYITDRIAPIITTTELATPNDNSNRITWSTNEESSTQIEYGFDTNYGNITTEIDTNNMVINHSDDITNLETCTKYHYRVISKDLAGNTLTGSDQTFTTTGCTGSSEVEIETTGSITKESGGEVELQENGKSKIKLKVPSNFSNKNANFQIKKLEKEAVIATISTPDTTKKIIGDNVYQLDALSDVSTKLKNFDESISISMSYTTEQISGYGENTLSIYRWDGSSWHSLNNCSIDTTNKIVSCDTLAFSTFILFGEEVVNNFYSINTIETNSGNKNPHPGDVCNSFIAETSSDLFQIDVTDNSAKLFFSPLLDTDTYHFSYSTNKNFEEFAVIATLAREGVQNFTIDHLKPNTTYYFKVRGIKDCWESQWSMAMEIKTKKNNQKTKRTYYKYSENIFEEDDNVLYSFTNKLEENKIEKETIETKTNETKTNNSKEPMETLKKEQKIKEKNRCFLWWCF